MAAYENHIMLYEQFKKDAEKEDNYGGTRVEAYFLSSYHLIDACAAKQRVHINKHQMVRTLLEQNEFIFGKDTEAVWKTFQIIENQKRPKFAYSGVWTEEDMQDAINAFRAIERICIGVLNR